MNILYDERVDGALPKVDKAALLAELQAQLPDLDILHRSEDLKPYECDGLSPTAPRRCWWCCPSASSRSRRCSNCVTSAACR